MFLFYPKNLKKIREKFYWTNFHGFFVCKRAILEKDNDFQDKTYTTNGNFTKVLITKHLHKNKSSNYKQLKHKLKTLPKLWLWQSYPLQYN